MSLRRSLHRAAQLMHGCDGCKSRLFTRAKSWLETSQFFRYETFEPNLSAVKEKAILLLHCIKMSLKIWKRKEEIELLWLLLSHFISFCAISSNEPHFHGKKEVFSWKCCVELLSLFWLNQEKQAWARADDIFHGPAQLSRSLSLRLTKAWAQAQRQKQVSNLSGLLCFFFELWLGWHNPEPSLFPYK